MPNTQLTDRPLPSSFDENEDFYNSNGFQKVARRLKQEPLVPLGAGLTVLAFVNAYRAMRRGDHHQVQRMFRARVAAQGFTVLAIVAGGAYFGQEREKQKELARLKAQQAAEEKRQKWIRELELRDEEDKAMRAQLDKRRRKVEDRRAAEVAAATAASATTAVADGSASRPTAAPTTLKIEDGEKKEGGGVLGQLGGWFGTGKKASEQEPEKGETTLSSPEPPKK